ncbi:MAG: hypothetical protein ACYS0H_29840, partial [Planctomycetota bacterium]
MKIKNIITGILLLFVGISVGYAVMGESRPDRSADESSAHAVIESSQDDRMVGDSPEESEGPNQQVIAYYFHGTRRCVTCQTIES